MVARHMQTIDKMSRNTSNASTEWGKKSSIPKAIARPARELCLHRRIVPVPFGPLFSPSSSG